MGTDNQNSQETTQEPRTFTQEEVNSFLANDRRKTAEKYADYEELKEKAAKFDEVQEAQKSELQKAQERVSALEGELNGLKKENEVRTVRETVAKESGVPASLLTGTTEEECKAQAEAIKAFARPDGYPKVKDGGEVSHSTEGGSTRQQFADWFSQAIN